jgi:Flp pilus assembly protein TadG
MAMEKTRTTAGIRATRRGTTLVESAIVLGSVCMLLLGMLEISLALVRLNAVSEAARRISRAAITHGEKCNAAQGKWGPTTLTMTAASDHPAAAVAKPFLTALDPTLVSLQVEWPDGDAAPDSRVRVTVSTSHQSLVWSFFSTQGLVVSGQSTMRIAH